MAVASRHVLGCWELYTYCLDCGAVGLYITEYEALGTELLHHLKLNHGGKEEEEEEEEEGGGGGVGGGGGGGVRCFGVRRSGDGMG